MNSKIEVPDIKACGIDFGTSEIAVAVVNSNDPYGAKLVGNMLAKETTPGVVKFYNGMRSYAEDAAATSTMCPQNVISHIPLVLEYTDCIEQLPVDYPDLCFSARKLENGDIAFKLVDYEVEEVTLTHVISMLLRYIYSFTKRQYADYLHHTVICLPPKISDKVNRMVVDAATLAGFEDIKIVTTDMAQAFNYTFRLNNAADESLEKPHHVVFMDCGCIFSNIYDVRLSKEGCEIVKSVNRKVGAKDMDVVLFNYFRDRLMHDKYGHVIEENQIANQSKKAIRLMNGCCALKKMLSAASRATNNVDSLNQGNDYTLSLTRAEFVSLCKNQIDLITELVDEFMTDFNEPIEAVEMIGGGSRIPFVQDIITSKLHCPLRFTVDSASCIAKGAALIGIFDAIKEKSAIQEIKYMPVSERNEDMFKQMEECEMKLRTIDAEVEKKGLMSNQIESQMRNEQEGQFKNKLNNDVLDKLLHDESEWLIQNEEEKTAKELEEEYNRFKTDLETQFSDFFKAKEEDRVRIEKELEKESLNRDTTKDDDVKLPYKQRMSRVEANKKEAGDLFKDKNYVAALQRYKRALSHSYKFFDCSPQQKEEIKAMQITLNVNCAICLMKLAQWDKVVEYCTNVLKEDPTNKKALFRRADAFNHQKDTENCSKDLEQLLKIMPEDAGVLRIKAENDRRIKAAQEKRKRFAKKMFGGN